MKLNSPTRRHHGFLLLEAMIAVAIFALGVLTLGRCVSNCLNAQQYKAEDSRARMALENRFAAIESGAVALDKDLMEDLEGSFKGLKLRQTSSILKKQNEKKEDLNNLVSVRVEVTWVSEGEKHAKDIRFYARSTPKR